jgi:hypothetical protein
MDRWVRVLVVMALLGMLHWLFGNLYEEIVIAPNWLVNSRDQLQHLHAFFVRTSPTTYFVPITFLAPVLVWTAHALQRRAFGMPELRWASLFALAATVLNAVIVTSIVTRLFGDGYAAASDAALHTQCVRWNVLNGVRMVLVAATIFWLFAAFRRLDHRDAGAPCEGGGLRDRPVTPA